jgi:hypothetical protein
VRRIDAHAGAALAVPGAASAADPVFGVVPQNGALPPDDDPQLMRDGGVDSISLMAQCAASSRPRESATGRRWMPS